MVTLELKPGEKVEEKQALYIKFNYNLDLLRRVKNLPKRFYHPNSREWEIPLRYIDQFVTSFQDVDVTMVGKFPKHYREKIQNVARFTRLVVDASEFEFKTKPYQHQVEGFNYAMEHNKFIEGDEQGLGKSKQAIDAAVARKSQFKHCLIVCGINGLKYNWLNEVRIHSNEKARIIGSRYNKKGRLVEGTVAERLADLVRSDLDEFFLITNHETLRNKSIQKQLRSMTDRGIIGMVIIDEFHKCAKNPTSQTGEAIHELRSFYKIPMTGTPLVNDPRDFYNILKWIDVEKHSWTQFQANYCETGVGFEVVGYKNLVELRDIVNRSMLRRTKSETLDLPEKIPITEYVEMGPKQERIYDEVRTQLLRDVDKIALMPNPLAGMIRLRQATGYTGILSTQVRESAKLQRMVELVDDIVENGQKVVIFSNWVQMTEVARKYLEKYKCAYVIGGMSAAQVDKQIQMFQEDTSCLVIMGTIDCLGVGHNLVQARTALFLDSPWNPATKDQCADRIHRIGTKESVNIITLVTKGTIDERIEEIIDHKQDLVDFLVNGKMEKLQKIDLIYRLIN